MKVGEFFATLGIRADTKSLEAGKTAILGFGAAFQRLISSISASDVFNAVSGFADEMIELGDNLNKTSQQLGLSATALKEWQFAAELSGISAEEFNVGVSTLIRNAGEASKGIKSFKRDFDAMGVSVTDANGELKSSEQILNESIEGLIGMENETKRSAVAMRLFGRAGRSLAPLLNAGTEGIEAMRKEVRDLVGEDLEDFQKSAAASADAMARWELRTESLKIRIANVFLPVLNRFLDFIAQASDWMNKMAKNTRVVKVAAGVLIPVLTVLAGAILLPWLAAIAPIVLVGAAIAGLILIVEDVIAFFSGERSALGALIEPVGEFLVGVWHAVAAGAVWLWDQIVDGVTWMFRKVVGFFTSIGAWIENTFDDAVDFVSSKWIESIVTMASNFDGFVDWISNAIDSVVQFFTDGFQSISDFVMDIVDGIVEAFTSAFDGIKEAFGGVTDFISEASSALGDVLGFDSTPAIQTAVQSARASAAGAQVAANQTVTQQNRVGQIVIQGADDPQQTANRVRDTLQRTQVDQLRAARAAFGDVAP